MTDNELLLAISDMMDKKLQPIDNRIRSIESQIENDIMPRLQMIGRMESLLENDIVPRIRRMEMLLENDIVPRLQTIESCYTSTYRRYANGIEQHEAMQSDIEIMKKVIIKHSEILHKIS